MSDQSNLSKIIIPILAFLAITLIFSCAKKPPKKLYNTEILCPNNVNILVKYSRAQDVSDGIKAFLVRKRKERTSENYTIIRFKDERSLRIEKIPPEKLIECFLRESEVGVAEKWYIYHY
jgi:hypothetical protein